MALVGPCARPSESSELDPVTHTANKRERQRSNRPTQGPAKAANYSATHTAESVLQETNRQIVEREPTLKCDRYQAKGTHLARGTGVSQLDGKDRPMA